MEQYVDLETWFQTSAVNYRISSVISVRIYINIHSSFYDIVFPFKVNSLLILILENGQLEEAMKLEHRLMNIQLAVLKYNTGILFVKAASNELVSRVLWRANEEAVATIGWKISEWVEKNFHRYWFSVINSFSNQ